MEGYCVCLQEAGAMGPWDLVLAASSMEWKAIVFVYRKQAPWDPEILRAVKARDHSAVLYTARPATMRANQVPYELKESRIKKNASFTAGFAGHSGILSYLLFLAR